MKYIQLLVIGLLLCSPILAETGFLNRSVKIKGETFRYQVYLPADYPKKEKFPVIISLHGNGSQGSDGLKQTAGGFADHVRQNPSLIPAIVVFPQARANTRWLFPEMQDLVMAELEQTMADFSTDPN